MKSFSVFKVLTVFLFMIQFVFAQTKTGTTIGQFLLIEPSGRYMGMGNAAVTFYDDITAAYYNPAAVGWLSGYGVQFTHSLWIADIQYDYVAALVSLGSIGNLQVSLTSLTSGEIKVRTVEQPKGTGEYYSVQDFAIGVGYGRQLIDRLSIGFHINYVQETIWHSSLATMALNIGTIFQIIPGKLTLGASISNFGLPASFDGRDLIIQYDQDPDRYGDNSSLPGKVLTGKFPLPIIFRVGLSAPYQINETQKIRLAINAFHPNNNTESISLGGEWMFKDLIALRTGYQHLFQQDSETGLTFGLGLHLKVGNTKMSIDYAWADRGRLKETQHFTIGLYF